MSTFHAEHNMWEVFNIPPVQPVIYNSILSTKREFSDLVHGYMSHHLEHDKIHCCKIVPDLSSFSEKQKIFIIILADFPSKSNLCFRIKISKRDILDEVNKYLVFMKKMKYEVLYLLSGENIYVTCQHFENWNLFYDLYKLLLSKPITTILGTQFYCSFVCKNLMYNELKFLKTCSIMKNSEAFIISTKASTRNSCEVLADNVYAYHFPRFCSPSKKEKNAHEFETDARTFGFKTVVSKKIKSSDVALNSTKRKLMNFSNYTAKHEPQIKRKKTFEDYRTSCCSRQREKIQTSPQIFRETSFAHSCDKLLKRKHVDIQSCVNEIPLKQPKIQLSSSNCEHSYESSTFHKLSDSPKQSLCRCSKWKMFSDIEHFGPIDYVDLLSSKCDLDKSSNILKKSQMQFRNLFPCLQQEHTNFKLSKNNKLKVVSTYALSESKECKYFKIEPAVLNKSIKKPNDRCSSSAQILRKESSIKSNPDCASVSQLKEYTLFQPRCSNEHELKLNKNSIKSVSGFKTAGGNAILCSQTALLTAQNVLQDVLDENVVENNESFHSKTVKKNYSKLVKKGNNLNPNSITDSENKEVDETKMDIVLTKHFFDECFDEKTTDIPPKVNENIIKSFGGFTSAAGNAIKCSQSALLAAQKILQNISEENSEEKKESLNSNKSSNKINHLSIGGNKMTRNSVASCETKEVDDTQMDIILPENIFRKECLDKKGTNLPSMVSESKDESFSGFKSAGGNTIKCSQSALMAAQKMLLDISDEKDEDQNECVDLVVPKKSKSTVHSKDNLDRNFYDLHNNENVEEPQIDIALPENFFTEKCFDEGDIVFPNDQKVVVPSASILSEDVSNTSSNKRKKTLGTRRSLPMFPKKDLINVN